MDKQLEDFFHVFLNSEDIELEARFGTKTPISRIKFDNVIKKLKSLGFKATVPSGSYHLNINNEFINPKMNQTQISNVRTQIHHLNYIKDYCKSNTFNLDNPPDYITFYQKRAIYKKGQRIKPLDYHDFEFRVNLKEEKVWDSQSKLVQLTLQKWKENKKIFRFLKRFTFIHPNLPLKIDCSVVKSSKKTQFGLKPEYTIEAAGIFTRQPTYEIEIEMNSNIQDKNQKLLIKKFKTAIKYVLSGLQQSNFPISLKESNMVLQNYMNILHSAPRKGKKEQKKIWHITPRNFVGPSPMSLQMINIIEIDPDIKAPNIRQPYTVTDKADGIRKLLFIAENLRIYLIDTNMNVQFTGTICGFKDYKNTILDGEHILHDKNGKFINLFLVFDLYYKSNKDYRGFPFIPSDIERTGGKYRIQELSNILGNLELKSLTSTNKFVVRAKTFSQSSGKEIFQACKEILAQSETYEYEIDGLIFTPSIKTVGSDNSGKPPRPYKRTWKSALKWKPKEFNTVDFLITTKKMSNGLDFIGNIFENGENLAVDEQLTQYKTLILRVGFDETRHGYLNPCEDIVNENFLKLKKNEESSYRPVPFYPSNPSDKNAYMCNIILQSGDHGSKYLFTENKEDTFEDNTIVEFRYDTTRKVGWRWIPIRVRYDKTTEYRSGGRNYGNAYHVAQSVWESIHNPITREIISSGENIPSELGDDDVYYKKTGKTSTRALRDFHNLYVKRQLIMNLCHAGGTLIDLACGKGGDLPKWIHKNLSFVFGIDISRDNIENRIDGACARFLNYRKTHWNMPYCLFVNGDSKLNIRNGNACVTDKGKQITKAIFGEGIKDEAKLGSGVFKHFGLGKEGFDVVSCQFALHYFFSDIDAANSFLRNVSETCKIGGYFVGTCYSGERVFEKLEETRQNDSVLIIDNEKKMWELKKKYDSDTFNNDETSIGYAIDVYQESINKTFREYLVNFTYLTRLLVNYGFRPLNGEELKSFGLPNSVGSFKELFYQMETFEKQKFIKKKDYGRAFEMTANEKTISFLNNYFVFKKIRNINSEQVSMVMAGETEEEKATQEAQGDKLTKIAKQDKPKGKKKKGKIKLTV